MLTALSEEVVSSKEHALKKKSPRLSRLEECAGNIKHIEENTHLLSTRDQHQNECITYII